MRNFKKFLALVLATLMVASVMVFTAPAASAATDDHADDIAFLAALDVFKGYSADNAGADDPILRYQMALFLARITTGITDDAFWKTGASAYFTDCNEHTYPGAIDYCYKKGYINGKGDGIYDPWGQINYQEALTMLVRLLGHEKKNDVFPIDQFITASTLKLTKDISGSLTKALTRKEVADLVVKALYIPVKDAEGATGDALIEAEAGLNAQKIGDAKLVATWNAAINGHAFSGAYDTVVFQYTVEKTGDDPATDEEEDENNKYTVTVDLPVKVANVTKSDVLSMNDYLGFNATLVSVKDVKIATMRNVKVVEANVTADNKIKADGKEFTKFLVYGADAKNVFKANDGTVKKGTSGKVVICDVTNNGTDANDIIRFIPFNTTKAFYVAEDVKLTKNDGKAWPKNSVVDMYYEPGTGKANDYEVVITATVPGTDDLKLASKVIGVQSQGTIPGTSTKFGGFALVDGVSDGTSTVNRRIELATPALDIDTSLYVSVIGELKHAEVAISGYKKIGNLTFIAVGNAVEIESGKATLNELAGTQLKLGDTFLGVGFTKANDPVNGWYSKFADVNAIVSNAANLGKEFEYKKVDGKIVYLAAPQAGGTTTPTTTYLPNPLSATPVFVNFTDKTELKVAADGTIEIGVIDPKTLETSTIKIDQINGVKVGTLYNQFGWEPAKTIAGYAQADDLTELVEYMLGKATLVADGDNYKVESYGNKLTFEYAKSTIIVVTVANKADDVYSLTTEKNAKIEQVVLGKAAADKDNTDGSATINFVKYSGSSLTKDPVFVGTYNAKSTTTPKYTFASKYLTITKDTQIVVIAQDQAKKFTNLTNVGGEDFLKIVDSGNAFVLALSNDLIVIVNNDLELKDLAKFEGAAVEEVEVTGKWYTLTWTSKFVSTTAETVGNKTYFKYTFTGLRNLTTGEDEPVVEIISENYTTTPETEFFGNAWIGGAGKEAIKGAAGSNGKLSDANAKEDVYKVFYIDSEGAIYDSSMFSWAKANGYKTGVLQNMAKGDANLLVIDECNVVCTENGKYTVTVKTANAVKAVVGYQITYFNLSAGITDDEISTKDHNGYTAAMAEKILGLGKTYDSLETEYCFYKLNADGTAEFVVNMFDGERYEATNTVADELAKAPAVE